MYSVCYLVKLQRTESITIYSCTPECSVWCKKKTVGSHDGVLTIVLVHEKEYSPQRHTALCQIWVNPYGKLSGRWKILTLKSHYFRTRHVSSCSSFFLSCEFINTVENKIMTKEFAGLLIFLPMLTMQQTLIYAIYHTVNLVSAEFRDQLLCTEMCKAAFPLLSFCFLDYASMH